MAGKKKAADKPRLTVEQAVEAVAKATKARVLAAKRYDRAFDAEREAARLFSQANGVLAKARKALNETLSR
ncbi:MAG: hypothetical protein ACHQC8_02655 [Solirubrobacterales bacterium]